MNQENLKKCNEITINNEQWFIEGNKVCLDVPPDTDINIKYPRGARYNFGKIRYELIPPKALRKVAEVYTKGSEKYTKRDADGVIISDGANNWRLGMPWMETMGSVQRHIEAWKEGEDIDKDLGTAHLANAVFGLLALLEFADTHPNMDDRPYKV